MSRYHYSRTKANRPSPIGWSEKKVRNGIKTPRNEIQLYNLTMKTHLIILASVVVLAGCGNGKTETDTTGVLSDAAAASSAISHACGVQAGVEGDTGDGVEPIGDNVDKLIALHNSSDGNQQVEDAMRNAANFLRTCNEDGYADRLNAATDK
jgi:hypothetical protein